MVRIWPTSRATSSKAPGRGVDVRGPELGCQQMPAAEDIERQVAVAVIVAVEEPRTAAALRNARGRALGGRRDDDSGSRALAHLLALAIGQELSVHDLLRMPFYHPTLEEGLRTALRAVARQLSPCRLSDLARCGLLGVEALD